MRNKKVIILATCIILVVLICVRLLPKSPSDSSEEPLVNETLKHENINQQTPPAATKVTNNSSTTNSSAVSNDITLHNTSINKLGNSLGNLAQGGIMTSQGNWLYFQLPKSTGMNTFYRSMSDMETAYKKISDSPAQFINIIGEWAYFFSVDTSEICKIKTDGASKGTLVRLALSPYFIAVSNTVYFNSTDGISKINTSGTVPQLITKDYSAGSIQFSDNNIFYIKQPDANSRSDEEDYRLFSIGIDGKNRKQLTEEKCANYIVDGNFIYYTNNESNLYKIKKDGSGSKSLLAAKVNCFNVSNNTIYFTPIADASNLYIMSANGKNKIKLTNKTPNNITTANNYIDESSSVIYGIYIVNDYIYCSSYFADTVYMLRMKNDGSLQKNIYLYN